MHYTFCKLYFFLYLSHYCIILSNAIRRYQQQDYHYFKMKLPVCGKVCFYAATKLTLSELCLSKSVSIITLSLLHQSMIALLEQIQTVVQ